MYALLTILDAAYMARVEIRSRAYSASLSMDQSGHGARLELR